MSKQKQFFLVWSPQGDMPRARHETRASARREADRLARANHGKEFMVLTALEVFHVARVTHEIFEIDQEDSDDIPF